MEALKRRSEERVSAAPRSLISAAATLGIALRSIIFMLLVLWQTVGCRPEPVTPPVPNAPAEPAAVVLKPIDKAGFTQFLAQHRGHVVLVDFWATWCPPCMEGFPDTVRLSRQYEQQGLVVASVALEEIEDTPKVLEFLNQQGAPFVNFVSAYGASDGRSMDEFELHSGTIPTLKLYDRQGNLRYTFGDGLPFTFEEIEVALRELLLKG